ncbi:cation:proton antiporter [Oscillatoria sp. FACHB-1406]|uniref:cation:proton antiporter domain-containing protein n=1 Tax=Oscillatoria sp. FACHB-1406 TaxID=2692846 RepID=UPI001684C60A|nr:cation:proton antiporter [Oscillatoria sp. FACHB-1406]MBD2579451.1 cation:proton antiporter [Oscillatoria sp. FACHB-1406]
MEQFQQQLGAIIPDTPLVSFTILILVSLFVPPIFEKIKLPGLVGLLVAGVILGPNILALLEHEDDTIELLSDAGKIYLMFVAGLEIDLDDFRKKRDRSLTFGVATFIVPMIAGIIVGRVFGFSWNTAVLIGSLLASHTLLGYPIVNRLGVVRNEAVTATIGATIFTDISALLVLAICVSIHRGNFTPASLAIQLISLAVYAAIVLFGIEWAGREYFRRTGDEESNQFLFVLAAVFIASVGAQMIQIEKIVGAFLAGLAINGVVGNGPVKEKVEFVGSALFIPFFFIGMGLLLDIPTFISTITSTTGLGLTFAIVLGLIGSKFIAALVPKFIYRYSWDEAITMWSLSMPQVAATLAAALVAYQATNKEGETLISKGVFNTVIVMMLVTSILGPVITARFAKKLSVPESASDWGEMNLLPEGEAEATATTIQRSKLASLASHVVVPIYNPKTQRDLIEMGAMLVRQEAGELIPLSVVRAHVHMDEPQLNDALVESQQRLKSSQEIAEEFGVSVKPMMRIDDDVTNGISRAARECNASLVVMGWSRTRLRSRLFGTIIDRVFWASHCPVAVVRLLEEPKNIRRVLVPIQNLSSSSIRVLRFAQLFARTNQATVTLLRVRNNSKSREPLESFEAKLKQAFASVDSEVHMEVKSIAGDNVAQSILTEVQDFDLVVLHSRRRRTVAGLAVSDVTTEVIKKLNGSMVIFGEPHS